MLLSDRFYPKFPEVPICGGKREDASVPMLWQSWYASAMCEWLANNAIGLLGAFASIFTAYHVFFLSRRLGLREKLQHKSQIVAQVEPLLAQMASGRRRKVELVNAKVYPNHYLGTNTKTRHGYPYLGAELKATRFDGLEFFCEVVAVYQKENGDLTLKEGTDAERLEKNAFAVGVMPYEWIEFVDSRGDEFSYRPQFFTNFSGPKKSPYKYIRYYRESEVFHEGSDPADMKWVSFEPV